VFIEAEDDGSGGDSWSCSSCKAPVKHHHQQTNTQFSAILYAIPTPPPSLSESEQYLTCVLY